MAKKIKVLLLLLVIFYTSFSQDSISKKPSLLDTVVYVVIPDTNRFINNTDTFNIYFINAYNIPECKVKSFSPAVITGIGNKNSIYVAIGLQGQKLPISFFIGMKENPTSKRHSRFYEPFIEMNFRTLFTKYFGIHAYVLASDQVFGYGGVINVRVSNNLGIRTRIGSQQGFHYSFGLITLLN